jgi:hypothetical protein
MNLREFLNYRNNCPLCSSELKIYFHSDKKQKIRFEEDKFIATFILDPALNNKKRSKPPINIDYIMGLDDNSLLIDFVSKDKCLINPIPLSIVKRFQNLNINLGNYMIYKKCPKCKNYHYFSNEFNLNLSKKTIGDKKNIGDLIIENEYFSMMCENGYKYFKLDNFYRLNKSFVEYGKFIDKKIATIKNISLETIHYYDNRVLSYQIISTELIKFTTKDKTLDRLNKLICFI